METLVWLLKVNVAITLLYAFYKLLFQRDTFFNLKRIALLSSIFFALLYPFFDVKELFLSKSPHLEGNLTAIELPEFLVLSGAETAPQTMSITSILNIIWIAGVILFFLYFIFQIISILSKIFSSKRMQIQGTDVYVLKDLKTPFSFFNHILINPDFHDEQEISEILHHEETHVREKHTYDVIISELFCVLCWFNPFAWLLKKEIRINLEFLADKFVMKSVKNTEHYQLHLLRLSYHKAIAQLSNNFNVSPLKKRIKMMNKKKSSVAGIIKYALFVPLLIGLLCVNGCKKAPKNLDESAVTDPVIVVDPTNDIEQLQESREEIFTHVDEMPRFPGGEKEMMNFLSRNIKYPVEAQKQGVQGTVVLRFVVDKIGKVSDVSIMRSLSPETDEEAIRVVNAMPVWTPGKQNGEAVAVYYTLPVRFKLQVEDNNAKTSELPADEIRITLKEPALRVEGLK